MTKKQYVYDRRAIAYRFNLANTDDRELYDQIQTYLQEHGIKQPELMRQAFGALLGKRTVIIDQDALKQAIKEALNEFKR